MNRSRFGSPLVAFWSSADKRDIELVLVLRWLSELDSTASVELICTVSVVVIGVEIAKEPDLMSSSAKVAGGKSASPW